MSDPLLAPGLWSTGSASVARQAPRGRMLSPGLPDSAGVDQRVLHHGGPPKLDRRGALDDPASLDIRVPEVPTGTGAINVATVHVTGRRLDRLRAEPGQFFSWR